MSSPNKENFFLSINKDLEADESFYKKIYGYSVTDSAFPAKVANKLIEVGRKEVVQGYNQWLQGYLAKDKENMKEAAAWLQKEIDKEYERRVKEREWEQKAKQHRKILIQSMTRKELTELCQKLLKEGVIQSPEQFVTAVELGQ